MADLLGIPRRGAQKENPDYLDLKMGIIPNIPIRTQQVLGIAKDNDGNQSIFNKEKWKYLLVAPFPISNQCCNVMKKAPLHKFKGIPMTAQTASESRLRTEHWLRNGCNGFNMKRPISNPMSFWLEQDVLLYIKLNNLPICSVYGDIVEDADELDGQMCLFDYDPNAEIFDKGRPLLKTTGCDRTGCMFCGYGCHLEKDGQGRFERMKVTHPKQYDYIMRPKEQGGLNYKEVIDWLNENGNLHIRY